MRARCRSSSAVKCASCAPKPETKCRCSQLSAAEVADHGAGGACRVPKGSDFRGDARTVAAAVRALGSEYGIEAVIAHDGLELTLG